MLMKPMVLAQQMPLLVAQKSLVAKNVNREIA
jgi:hypothetical protein